jgi:hypothetical protein
MSFESQASRGVEGFLRLIGACVALYVISSAIVFVVGVGEFLLPGVEVSQGFGEALRVEIFDYLIEDVGFAWLQLLLCVGRDGKRHTDNYKGRGQPHGTLLFFIKGAGDKIAGGTRLTAGRDNVE